MIRTISKQLLSISLCFLLVITTVHFEAGAQEQQAQPAAPPEYSGQGAPLQPEELQQLVAPIALYPDSLVAQILGAATFPDQVDAAAGWLQQNQNLTGNNLMKAVDQQPWDPSVKALTQFPSVLDNLAKNLSWTSSLGEAYHTQAADVMTAVQVLRAKAQAAGNLKSGSQITVVQESPQTIVIQPANPQVVYVPTYNPTVVYGYSLCDSWIQRRGCGDDCGGCVWSRHRRRRDDERRVWLGIQQLELQLAQHYRHLSRRIVLRECCLARRLLRFRWGGAYGTSYNSATGIMRVARRVERLRQAAG